VLETIEVAVAVTTCGVCELAVVLDVLEVEVLVDEFVVVDVVDDDKTVPFAVPVVNVAAPVRVETFGMVVDMLEAELVTAPARFANPTAAGLYRYTE